ncbi:MAG: hypothetical protein Q7R93_05130 [bacterium]|nr:hypothetical protein [bacterium]
MNIDDAVEALRFSVRSGTPEDRALFQVIMSLPLTDIPTPELMEYLRKFLHPVTPHVAGIRIVFDTPVSSHTERVSDQSRFDTVVPNRKAERLMRLR